MCVAVSGEENQLEEDHACGPHRWRAAKVGKDDPTDHRLNEEEKTRTQTFLPSTFLILSIVFSVISAPLLFAALLVIETTRERCL